MKKESGVIFFDDQCIFCNYWVRWLVHRDSKKIFYFSPIGSKQFLSLRHDSRKNDQITFVYANRSYFGFQAIQKIISQLQGNVGFGYRIIAHIPQVLGQAGYLIVARSRNLFFRKHRFCKREEKISERIVRDDAQMVELVDTQV